MIGKTAAMKAYQNALSAQQNIEKQVNQRLKKNEAKPEGDSFMDTVSESLKSVNDMQQKKYSMITDFAAGKETNVHELMIQMQKAGLAMSMTTAVRSKVMQAYQEVMKMQF